ncbi:hypothetical protein AAVH_39876, partial [Aphelenchoides avenae]
IQGDGSLLLIGGDPAFKGHYACVAHNAAGKDVIRVNVELIPADCFRSDLAALIAVCGVALGGLAVGACWLLLKYRHKKADVVIGHRVVWKHRKYPWGSTEKIHSLVYYKGKGTCPALKDAKEILQLLDEVPSEALFTPSDLWT